MRIYVHSLKRPKRVAQAITLWFEDMTDARGREIAAGILGWSSWKQLAESCNRSGNTPSPVDEACSETEQKERLTWQTKKLQEMTELIPEACAQIIDYIRPSGSCDPLEKTRAERRALEEAAAHFPDDLPDDETDEEPAWRMDASDMNEAMGHFLERNGIEAGDPATLLDRLRISIPLNYGVWADYLAHLGWTVVDFDPAPEYLEPAFSIAIDGDRATLPVSISSIAYMPGDTDDEMAEEIFEMIEAEWDDALLLFRLPMMTESGGHNYSFCGRLLLDGEWHDVALNTSMQSADDLLRQAASGFSMDNLLPQYADDRMAMAEVAELMFNFDPLQYGKWSDIDPNRDWANHMKDLPPGA